MVGLGISADVPSNALQPRLEDGVHLRWSFRRELGFPRHGFHLFRRRHQAGVPVCIAAATSHLPVGPWESHILDLPGHGRVSSDRALTMTAGPSPPAPLFGQPARPLRATVRFRQAGEIQATALLDDVPVAHATISGSARLSPPTSGPARVSPAPCSPPTTSPALLPGWAGCRMMPANAAHSGTRRSADGQAQRRRPVSRFTRFSHLSSGIAVRGGDADGSVGRRRAAVAGADLHDRRRTRARPRPPHRPRLARLPLVLHDAGAQPLRWSAVHRIFHA